MRHITKTHYQRLVRHDYAGPRSSLLNTEEWTAPYWSLQLIEGLGTCLVPTDVHPDDKVQYRGEWVKSGDFGTPEQRNSSDPMTFEDARAWLLAEIQANRWEWIESYAGYRGQCIQQLHRAVHILQGQTTPIMVKAGICTLEIIPHVEACTVG